MSTLTANLKLVKPDLNEQGWGDMANANFDAIDAVTPVASLFVSPNAGAPLAIDVAAGSYERQDGTIGAYAGVAASPVPASTVTHVWLSSAGSLATGTVWPSTALIRLATVVAGATSITGIVDERSPYRVAGNGTAPWLLKTGGVMDDGAAIEAGTATGLKVGASGSQKLGFWGAAPVARPGPYTSGYAPSSRSMAGYTPASLPPTFSGLATGQAGTPYAQVADLNTVKAAYDNLNAFTVALAQQHNALIADLKAVGFIS